jgi:hypothetical protein
MARLLAVVFLLACVAAFVFLVTAVNAFDAGVFERADKDLGWAAVAGALLSIAVALLAVALRPRAS